MISDTRKSAAGRATCGCLLEIDLVSFDFQGWIGRNVLVDGIVAERREANDDVYRTRLDLYTRQR